MANAIGLVMTGGGARGAYQAGVLKRIGEIKRVQTHGNPFSIIEGASAGAINGFALAAGSDDFALVTKVIARLWSGLTPSDIFRCDVLSQTRNSLTWILDLSFGGFIGGGHARSLLDATPLRHFLSAHINCDRIPDNIKRGHLYALAISATNYSSGKGYLFIQGMKGHPMWNRSRRVTLATKITVEHICASAAIPLIFQPVRLKTTRGTAF
jgi:NTE family protein